MPHRGLPPAHIVPGWGMPPGTYRSERVKLYENIYIYGRPIIDILYIYNAMARLSVCNYTKTI